MPGGALPHGAAYRMTKKGSGDMDWSGLAFVAVVVLAAFFWIQWQHKREEADKWHRNYLASVAAHAETRRGWERDSQCWNERLTAGRARMAEISDLVSRRPPRRRWLAMARNVAKIAANSV